MLISALNAYSIDADVEKRKGKTVVSEELRNKMKETENEFKMLT